MAHLDVLINRLHSEKSRLAIAKTTKEKTQRQIWIAQIEREIQSEKEFLGEAGEDPTDDEILAALGL